MGTPDPTTTNTLSLDRWDAVRGVLAWTSLAPSLSHKTIAESIGVTRQAIYHYSRGMEPTPERAGQILEWVRAHSNLDEAGWAEWWRDYRELLSRP